MLLTDITIQGLKPSDDYVTWFDKALPAFGVRVGKRSKTFVVVLGKQRKRISLGKYPRVSLKDARQRARDILHGVVPLPTPPPPPTSPTVSDAVALFLEKHGQKISERTIQDYRRVLHKHVVPQLGAVTIDGVATEMILEITDGLSETPAEAIHTHAAMRTLFNWLVTRRLIKTSPLAGLALPAKPGTRDRVLSDAELKAVYSAAVEMAFPFGFLVLICIHTGMRRSEVAALKWSYITPDYITLPGEMTKNGQQHVIPNLIGENLKLIPKTSDYLFPSEVGTPFSAWSKNKAKLDKLSGVYDWVLHDLRRTFSTKLAEWQLAPPHVIERLLNHVTGSMTPLARIYNRATYMTEMRQALEMYEKHLATLMSLR